MSKEISVLPDVNLLLAYGWRTHKRHDETRNWIETLVQFATCPITELGFLRVSMSPAFRASFQDAMAVLSQLKKRNNCRFLSCSISVDAMSEVVRYKDTTDAYLVSLAQSNALRLATLDQGIISSQWGAKVAFNPL